MDLIKLQLDAIEMDLIFYSIDYRINRSADLIISENINQTLNQQERDRPDRDMSDYYSDLRDSTLREREYYEREPEPPSRYPDRYGWDQYDR